MTFLPIILARTKSQIILLAGVGKQYGDEDTMATLLWRAIWHHPGNLKGFHGSSGVKNLPAMQETPVWFLGLQYSWASLVKNPSTIRETWVRSLAWEDPLKEGMATHSSILACRIPWTEKTGGLQSMGSERVGHHWVTKHTHRESEMVSLVAQQERICLQSRRPGFDPWVGKIPWRRAWQPTPGFLPGESHGQRSLEGYSSWVAKSWIRLKRQHAHMHAGNLKTCTPATQTVHILACTRRSTCKSTSCTCTQEPHAIIFNEMFL